MFSSLIPVLLRRSRPLALIATAVSGSLSVGGGITAASGMAASGMAASAIAASAVAVSAALAPQAAVAQSMFAAAELDPQRFVLVASPVGSSGRYQLNVYEQLNNRQPCFAIGAGKPAAVNPLLATFDFTGICSRYIDANGYSVRVGPSDLAGAYRLLVRSEAADTLLIALPTKPGAGPEMVVARAGGTASGFHKLDFEPGWRLMRRQFRGRNLGHIYLFSEAWPGATNPAAAPAGTPGTAPAVGAPAALTPTATTAPAMPAVVPAAAALKPLNGSLGPAPMPRPSAPATATPLPSALPRL